MSKNDVKQENFEPTGMLDKSGEIILNVAEWYSIQAYVEYALQLPTSQADLRRELDVLRDDNWQEFTQLRLDMLDVYRAVNHHCTFWRDRVYPELVGLADDIAGYGRTCVDSYARLARLSDELGDDPEFDDETLGNFRESLDALIAEARRRKHRADNVGEEVSDFCDLMKASRGKLERAQGEAKHELESLTNATTAIEQKIKELGNQLAKAQADYANNLAASHSIPAYVWIPIFGWIAGGVVGAVSASELKRLQDAADRLKEQIDGEEEEAKRKQLLMLRYRTASHQLSHLDEDLGDVKDVIPELAGVWRSIGEDLDYVRERLHADKTAAKAIAREVNFRAVRDSWETVCGKADFWRKRAIIQVEKTEKLAA